jgi:hypothetical protein
MATCHALRPVFVSGTLAIAALTAPWLLACMRTVSEGGGHGVDSEPV